MGNLCRFIVAWCTHREWHRSPNCDNDSTTTTHWWSGQVWSCASQMWDKPSGGWVPTCDSAHLWQLYSAASLEHQAASTVTCYPTQSHYPDTEPTSPCPMLIIPSARLESDKYQSIGLTRQGFETMRSGLEPLTLGLHDLLGWEGALYTFGHHDWL